MEGCLGIPWPLVILQVLIWFLVGAQETETEEVAEELEGLLPRPVNVGHS